MISYFGFFRGYTTGVMGGFMFSVANRYFDFSINAEPYRMCIHLGICFKSVFLFQTKGHYNNS